MKMSKLKIPIPLPTKLGKNIILMFLTFKKMKYINYPTKMTGGTI